MVNTSDLTKFIQDQLSSHGVRLGRLDSSGWIKVYCVKGHDKRTPSLSINKSTGSFNCFGCGMKGNWNTLAAMIGAEQITEDNAPDPFVQLQYQLSTQLEREEKKELGGSTLPWDIKPWKKGWREVSKRLMRKVRAYKWFDDASRCWRILLPVYLYDTDPVGWVARRLDKSKFTPTRNSESMNGIAKYSLYPYWVVAKMPRTRSVVLVEGPYDALRLIDAGIPALALLGVNNYDPSCHVHLHNLGVRRVVLGLDNDEAGKKGRRAIRPQLRRDFTTSVWRYHSKDPGESTEEERETLRELL